MELLKVDKIEDAMKKLIKQAESLPLITEELSITECLGRILASDIISDENVPSFNRSTVDGFAVISKDTSGASENLPVFLDITGEISMGESPRLRLDSGQCAYVPTGGMIPEGADSVIMIEYCEYFTDSRLAVYKSSAPGQNMVMAGDDIKKDQILFKRGHRIKSADMGVLSAIGKSSVSVYQPWKIYILSTGDEIVSPSSSPNPGQVRDVNTYGLIGESMELGLNVIGYDSVGDSEDELKNKISAAMDSADIIIISGGSSQGKKDSTKKIIDELCTGGAFTHGLAVKPGKPTIIGFDSNSSTALIGLPGHPVAALLLFRFLVGDLWNHYTGDCNWSKGIIFGRITSNACASPGRKTFQLVRINTDDKDAVSVTPILGKSGLIRTLSQADGYIVMDVDDEGIRKDQRVKVFLL